MPPTPRSVRTDNLTDARHQQVAALRANGPFLALALHLLHVERLQLCREPIQEYRRPEDVRHPALCRLRDVVPHGVVDHLRVPAFVLDHVPVRILGFVLDAVLVEPLDRVDVRETAEWPCGSTKVRVQLFDECSARRVFEQAVDCIADLSTA